MQTSDTEHLTLPPGPKGTQRNAFKRITGYSKFLTELYEEYGDIVYFKLPMAQFCVVYTPEFIEEILVTRQSEFPTVNYASFSDEVSYPALTGQNGEEHRQKRPLFDTGFGKDRMRAYSDIVLREATRLRGRLEPGTVVKIQDEFGNYAWNCLIGCFLGRDVNLPYSDGKKITKYMRTKMLLQFLPGSAVLSKLPLPNVIFGKGPVKKLDDLIYRSIKRAREDSSHDGHDLASHFVRAKDQQQLEWSFENDEAIRDELIVLHAYVDAPIGALTLAVFYMFLNPSVRTRLEQEVSEVAGDRVLEFEDYDRLSYTQAFCKELLRFDPPTYVSLPRPLPTDVALGGYRIPKGTMLHTGSKVVQHRREYWDDPEAFKPERWLDSSSQRCPSKKHAYIPYGSGPHSCAGGPLADRILVYGIATLVQRLRLDPQRPRVPPVSNIGATVRGSTPVAVSARS